MATELMLTFPPPTLLSISLVPLDAAETSGRFRVWLFLQDRNVLLWDRKAENGFPELKILVGVLYLWLLLYTNKDFTETAIKGCGRSWAQSWSFRHPK